MQTFLPYPSFEDSARCLDRLRLGKQRVECKQLLLVSDRLRESSSVPWSNHPAYKMWQGYEIALARYGAAVCREWIRRGYNDSLLSFFIERGQGRVKYPKWYRDEATLERVCSSHRANLLRKNSLYYGDFNWSEDPAEGYYWPV